MRISFRRSRVEGLLSRPGRFNLMRFFIVLATITALGIVYTETLPGAGNVGYEAAGGNSGFGSNRTELAPMRNMTMWQADGSAVSVDLVSSFLLVPANSVIPGQGEGAQDHNGEAPRKFAWVLRANRPDTNAESRVAEV